MDAQDRGAKCRFRSNKKHFNFALVRGHPILLLRFRRAHISSKLWKAIASRNILVTMAPQEEKVTPVYLRSDDHGWIPALQLKVYNNKATVAVPKFKKEQDMVTCPKERKRIYYHDNQVIDLADYPNNVLPMQNLDVSGNLMDYKDMVELPFMHEVSLSRVLVLYQNLLPVRTLCS